MIYIGSSHDLCIVYDFYKFNSHLNAQGYSTKIKFFTFFKTIYIYLRQIFRQKMDTYNMYAFDFCTSFDQLESPG